MEAVWLTSGVVSLGVGVGWLSDGDGGGDGDVSLSTGRRDLHWALHLSVEGEQLAVILSAC